MQSLYGAIANTNKKEIMVSIDTIYQRVLALANKEQRGYITPQEFNLYANQAQMDIFEQYFYDLNQAKRIPGNDNEYHDTVSLIEEKLGKFKVNNSTYNGASLDALTDFYRLGNVYILESPFNSTSQAPVSKSIVVEEIQQSDLIQTQTSPLTRATAKRPIYYIQENTIYFYPPTAGPNGEFRLYYIRKPKKVNWTYIVVDEKPLYNSSAGDHQDFELHLSEETKLVIKILQLAGITIKDYNLVQVSAQKEISKIQQEKQ